MAGQFQYNEEAPHLAGLLRSINTIRLAVDVIMFKVLRATVHEAEPELFASYKRQYAAQGSSAKLAHVRRAFSEAVRRVRRLRAYTCSSARSARVLKHVRQQLTDRETAEEVTKAAFRLDDAYRRMNEDRQ